MTDHADEGRTRSDSPIEAYLDQLLAASLRGELRATRHLLAETEAHLRDAADDGEAHGLSPYEAEVNAVARFGSASALAAADRRVHASSARDLARQGLTSALLLGAIGGIAVGVSGVIAAGMRTAGGQRFLVDPPVGSSLSTSNCARWLAGSAPGTTCAHAGLADWANDTIMFRMVAGVLGLVALGAFFAIRRWSSRTARVGGLPPVVVETIGVCAFGTAGAWLAGLGIDAIAVSSGHGAGQWLSAAPVALAIAVGFGVRLVRELSQPQRLERAR